MADACRRETIGLREATEALARAKSTRDQTCARKILRWLEDPDARGEGFDLYLQAFVTAELQPRVNVVTYWIVDGPHGGDWVIDFTRARDWVYRGVPEQWNLRLKFPASLVYQGVSGSGIWDNLVLSFRVRLARNPDRYNKEFWTWLSKL